MALNGRGKRHEKAVVQEKLVETTNSLMADVFFSRFWPTKDVNSALSDVQNELHIKYTDAAGLDLVLLEQCFRLIEQTSADDYHKSEIKWSPAKKKKEMKLPDMKYIMLLVSEPLQDEGSSGRVVGFVSFMITYEDGHEVVYVYEIHLDPAWQSKGLGMVLVKQAEKIGRNVGVEKLMLTVFRANVRATQWYERQGYAVDEFSPPPRKLRNGTVKQSSYLILSKPLR